MAGEKEAEQCLVVPREYLFGLDDERVFDGYRSARDWGHHLGSSILELAVSKHGIFKPRKTADPREDIEKNPAYTQIIPCALFLYDDKIFTYTRLPGSGEQRLMGRHDILIGGHVNPPDYVSTRTLTENLGIALRRELEEEVIHPEGYDLGDIIGYVNDSTDTLGRVHFGVVFRIDAKSSDIRVRETEAMRGSLLSVGEIEQLNPPLTSWHQALFEAYKRGELGKR